MVGKGNLTVFESSNISETGMATSIKIGVHAQYIDLYLYDFFEPIPNDTLAGSFTKAFIHKSFHL